MVGICWVTVMMIVNDIVIMMIAFCREIGETGDCGKFAAGIAYMIAYLTLRLLFNKARIVFCYHLLQFFFPVFSSSSTCTLL